MMAQRYTINQHGAKNMQKHHLVGGFNPVEKYLSNWIISPGRGENKKMFQTTT